MRGCYEFLGGQAVVLFLTIQMSALLLCSVKTVIIGTGFKSSTSKFQVHNFMHRLYTGRRYICMEKEGSVVLYKPLYLSTT